MLRRRSFLTGIGLGLLSALIPRRAFLMATLTVSPNPAPVSSLVAVAGAGFQNAKTRLLLDGTGATTNIFRPRKDGTFNVGITVSATARTQTLVAQQLVNSVWTDKASTSIVVEALVPTPVPTPVPALTSAVYGPAIGIDGIGNTQVGGPNGLPTREVGYRFRAAVSSTLKSIQFTTTNGAGYSGGTGGSLEISVQSDNAGAPSGTRLATIASYKFVDSCCYWPVVDFLSPANLTAGAVYHIVFRNVDANPAVNFPSLNNHFINPMEAPLLQKYPDSDWRELYRESSTDTWHDIHPNGTGAYAPQLALFYGDGTIDGIDYSYLVGSVTFPASETFTPKADHDVTRLALRFNGSITARLTGGGLDASVALSSAGSWAIVSLVAALKAGVTYTLALSGSGSIKAMYKGSAYGNWPAATFFNDGSRTGASDQDLPFAFLR